MQVCMYIYIYVFVYVCVVSVVVYVKTYIHTLASQGPTTGDTWALKGCLGPTIWIPGVGGWGLGYINMGIQMYKYVCIHILHIYPDLAKAEKDLGLLKG